MTELQRVTALCARLGASPEQARTMAGQLLKRADQIAAQRGIPRPEAMRGLLEVVVKGRDGVVPARFMPGAEANDAEARNS